MVVMVNASFMNDGVVYGIFKSETYTLDGEGELM